jgi:uncharacterized protein (DUF58 family)
MIDAGRRMLAKDSELSHFDHTLNAMLLLSYVALRRGDSVGIMTIGAGGAWLPPRKGPEAINGLLNHVYDVQPSPEEVDYLAAATELVVKQRRRSLIVLLTNVRDEASCNGGTSSFSQASERRRSMGRWPETCVDSRMR